MQRRRGRRKSTKPSYTSIDDLGNMPDAEIKSMLSKVETQQLVTALYRGSGATRKHILGNMPDAAASGIKEDMKCGTPPNNMLIDFAQQKLLDIANRVSREARSSHKTAQKKPTQGSQNRSEDARQEKRQEQSPHRDKRLDPRRGQGENAQTKQQKASPLGKLGTELSRRSATKRTPAELVELLKLLAASGRHSGLPALSKATEGRIDDEFLELGLRLAVDGVELGTLEKILDTRKRTLMAEYARRLDVIQAAIRGIQQGTAAELVELECKAHLAE